MKLSIAQSSVPNVLWHFAIFDNNGSLLLGMCNFYDWFQI